MSFFKAYDMRGEFGVDFNLDTVYRIGRWTFDLSEQTFLFEHVNRNVTPPIFFGVSGVLERNAGGKLAARVTGGGKRGE